MKLPGLGQVLAWVGTVGSNAADEGVEAGGVKNVAIIGELHFTVFPHSTLIEDK